MTTADSARTPNTHRSVAWESQLYSKRITKKKKHWTEDGDSNLHRKIKFNTKVTLRVRLRVAGTEKAITALWVCASRKLQNRAYGILDSRHFLLPHTLEGGFCFVAAVALHFFLHSAGTPFHQINCVCRAQRVRRPLHIFHSTRIHRHSSTQPHSNTRIHTHRSSRLPYDFHRQCIVSATHETRAANQRGYVCECENTK